MKKVLSIFLSTLLLGSTFATAHSGKTDSASRHRDNINISGLGVYHYHCASNEAHLHKNGKCPYTTQKLSTKQAAKPVLKPITSPATKSATTPQTPSIPDWAKESMRMCNKSGLFNGFTDEISNPISPIKRSMFITAIYNLSDIDAEDVDTSQDNFIDVSPTSFYYYPVIWGVENNIINGTSKTSFSPNNYITREQISIIINNFIMSKNIIVSYDMHHFNDYGKMNTYALDAINNMQNLGILTADSTGNFRPSDYVTVAEMSKIMQNILTAFKNLYN